MRKSPLVLLGLLTVLAACDKEEAGEPTEAQMKEVVGANIRADVERTRRPNDKGFEGFADFDKVSCTAITAPAAGWNCTFKMTLRINGVEMSKEHTGFFARTAEGALTFKP